MTRLDFDPGLERLGEALRASTTIDLAREERAARPSRRARPRLLAGATAAAAASAMRTIESATGRPSRRSPGRHSSSRALLLARPPPRQIQGADDGCFHANWAASTKLAAARETTAFSRTRRHRLVAVSVPH
jgi:hypothetical protein